MFFILVCKYNNIYFKIRLYKKYNNHGKRYSYKFVNYVTCKLIKFFFKIFSLVWKLKILILNCWCYYGIHHQNNNYILYKWKFIVTKILFMLHKNVIKIF